MSHLGAATLITILALVLSAYFAVRQEPILLGVVVIGHAVTMAWLVRDSRDTSC